MYDIPSIRSSEVKNTTTAAEDVQNSLLSYSSHNNLGNNSNNN